MLNATQPLSTCSEVRLLIECADEEIAAKLGTNKLTSKLCMPAGKKHLVVPIESDKAFRKAVLGLGYGISQP